MLRNREYARSWRRTSVLRWQNFTGDGRTRVLTHLQIYDPRERLLVGTADAALHALLAPARLVWRRRGDALPRRILLLRLERIGDLVMALEAIHEVRRRARDAEITLAVGSWNQTLARHIAAVDRVDVLDLPWLARGSGADLRTMMNKVREWRHARFDLVVNFEGDIRTNLLAAAAGGRRLAGFGMGGGGPLLTDDVPFDPRRHTADNALALVDAALPLAAASASERIPRELLWIPDAVRARAEQMLLSAAAASGVREADAVGPLIGVHPAGGREVKQWPPDRFGRVAATLARELGAAVVLTGSASDRSILDAVGEAIDRDVPVLHLAGAADLMTLAAVIQRLMVYVTCDTGPMHMAAALGIPVVGIFGPSDPARYGPRGRATRAVRVDLPCSPCNRVRLPPARCTGHAPDCLAGVPVDAVLKAARELLADANPQTNVVHVLNRNSL